MKLRFFDAQNQNPVWENLTFIPRDDKLEIYYIFDGGALYKQKFGKLGEDLAYTYLENKQFEVLARNYRKKYGEIDLVALHKGTLHFIEVTTRSTDRFGKPAEAVNSEKMSKMLRLAQVFIKENKCEFYRYSFDVIEVKLNHLEGVL